MRRDRWSRLVGAGLFGLTLLALGLRAGAHQDDPGDLSLIHACVATRAGAVRIVGPTGACRARVETAAHWAAGPSGRFVDLGLTVFDTQTKLLWEKKVAGGGCLHCVEDRYNWCNATGIAAAGVCAVTNNWIAAVNAEAFAGFTDWRVPTRDELAGILLEPFPCDDRNPCIDPIFGPTAASLYWSATFQGSEDAWTVDFSSGPVVMQFPGDDNRVRAVRGP